MFWRALKNTDVIDVYINPKNPEESLIITAFSTTYKSHNLALIISGILYIFALAIFKQITVYRRCTWPIICRLALYCRQLSVCVDKRDREPTDDGSISRNSGAKRHRHDRGDLRRYPPLFKCRQCEFDLSPFCDDRRGATVGMADTSPYFVSGEIERCADQSKDLYILSRPLKIFLPSTELAEHDRTDIGGVLDFYLKRTP